MSEKSDRAKEPSNGLEVQHLEQSYSTNDSSEVDNAINERRLLFKVDLVVLNWLIFMCIMMDVGRLLLVSGSVCRSIATESFRRV